MTAAIQLVFFLRMLATGIIAPVLALLLMAHGATIETISLLIGVYSVTVVIAEFPSGVLADLVGQKRVFQLSNLFALLSFALMLVSQSAIMLLFAMISNGLSRAFASGTLDALAVNQSTTRDEGVLLKITSRFSILESAGLALGALIGGLMAAVGDVYAVNLAANILLYGLVFLFTLLSVREKRAQKPDGERTPTRALIKNQMKQSLSFIVQKGVVRTILIFSAVTGFAMIGVETYWQPAYSSFQTPAWSLGLVTFGVFLSVMLGSKLTERVLKKHTRRIPAAFLLLRALFGAGLIGLYFTTGAVPFVAVYMAGYFFLGSGGVAENTLIHRAAKDDQRSSILSLFSFILQIGGILASAAGFIVSTGGDYKLMWPIAGVLLLLCAGLRIVGRNKSGRSA